jgi:serine/threonine protein kinase
MSTSSKVAPSHLSNNSKAPASHEDDDNLANYVVDKKIGKGQFSQVYKAKRVSDGVTVALKKVPIAEMLDVKARNDCIKEIDLLRVRPSRLTV